MWRRRSAALQIAWVLACPGPPRRYRRALELWLSVVFKGEPNRSNAANTANTYNRFHVLIFIGREAERRRRARKKAASGTGAS